jgi:hypothetical protein
MSFYIRLRYKSFCYRLANKTKLIIGLFSFNRILKIISKLEYFFPFQDLDNFPKDSDK